MTDRDDLLRRVSRLNPAPAGEPLPIDAADSRPPLAWLIEGTPFMEDSKQPSSTSRRAPMIAAAVAALALVVGMPLLLRNQSDDSASSTTSAGTTVVPTTLVSDQPLVPVTAADSEGIDFPRMVALSADEVWATIGSTVGHWVEGRWSYYGFPNTVVGPVAGAAPLMRDLAVGPDDVVWIATDVGVFSFDGAEWVQRFDKPTGAVTVDREGTVWIGGHAAEEPFWWLAHRESDAWVRDDTAGAPVYGPATALSRVNSEIWLSTFGQLGGVANYDGTALTEMRDIELPIPGDQQVMSMDIQMYEAPGVLWAVGFTQASDGQMPMAATFQEVTWTPVELPEILRSETMVIDVAVPFDNAPWLLTPNYLVRLGTDWTFHPAGGTVVSLDVAPDGTVMYLDANGRVGRLAPDAEPTIVELPAASFGGWVIPSVAALSADDVWAKVGASTVGHWKDEAWSFYGFANGDTRIEGVAVGADGTAWVATQVGVFSFNGSTWLRRFDGPTSGLAVDPDGRVWIGGWKTIYPAGRYDSGRWLAYADAGDWVRVDGRGNPVDASVGTIAAFAGDDVWIASYGYYGVLEHFDGTAMTTVAEPGGGQVVAVTQSPDGVVWAAGTADNGLTPWVGYRDGDGWVTIDLPEELAGMGWAWNLVVDQQGTVWVNFAGVLASFDGTAWVIEPGGVPVLGLDAADDGTVVFVDMEGGVHTAG